MKTIIGLTLIGLAFFVALAAAVQTPASTDLEKFTGTWKGTLTLIGSIKDIDVTLKIGCTDGRLTAQADFDNRHMPTESWGEINEITPKGDELTILLTYRAKDIPGKVKAPADGSQARYTLKISSEVLSGNALNLRSKGQFNVKLNRTEAMVACIVTSASAR
ncbi:MAG: hypothetical protein Q8R40_04300 [bacterium]|nr:hypothetical protein [bacterium]